MNNRTGITIAIMFVAIIGILSTVAIFQKCGAKALLFGNGAGAAIAAMTGMCD
jgi:hypothetical protein